MPRRKSRAIIFAAVVALSIGAAAAYVAAAALRSGSGGDGFAEPYPCGTSHMSCSKTSAGNRATTHLLA